MLLLTNTSGAMDADEAVRLARLARAAGLPRVDQAGDHPRSRVTSCPIRSKPCGPPSSCAGRGSPSCPTARPIPVLCKHLEEAGCATVMPLGSWIGSNQGLRTRAALEIIVEQATVPVVVDAGLGAPSHAAEAMELGADAVLVNTAIGTAARPGGHGPGLPAGGRGRAGAGGGPGYRRPAGVAAASSPLTGFLS